MVRFMTPLPLLPIGHNTLNFEIQCTKPSYPSCYHSASSFRQRPLFLYSAETLQRLLTC